MSHGDKVTKIPDGFVTVVESANTPFAAIENRERRIYGIQFHTEVRNTEYGMDILKNFTFNISGAEANWTMDDFIELQINKIRETVGDKKKCCLVFRVVLTHQLSVCFCIRQLATN